MITDQETTTAPDALEQAHQDHLAALREARVLPDERDPASSAVARIEYTKKRAKYIHTGLNGKAARDVFLEVVATMPQVSDRAFRYLTVLLSKGDSDLRNCFASRKWVLAHLGGKRIGGRAKKDQPGAIRQRGWQLEKELTDAGVFYRDEHGGVQVKLPAGVLPDGEPWEGPADWPNRARQSWKKKRELLRASGGTSKEPLTEAVRA